MNNKIVVAVIILLSLGVFVWLVNYGWEHRYGSPETFEVAAPAVLAVNYVVGELALEPDDVFSDLWGKAVSVDVELKHQITERPWPTGLTPAVRVEAFHNGKNIYFRMTWQDDQQDASLSVDRFGDSCAVAIPIDKDAPIRSIMMGFSSTVNVWHWQAHKDAEFWQGVKPESEQAVDFVYPFEQQEMFSVVSSEAQSAVMDLLSARAGSLTTKETQAVQGRGLWRDGKWTVVIKRALTTTDLQKDSQFDWGNRQVSFAVWDGDQEDRGSRKSISEWVNLQIEPPTSESASSADDEEGVVGIEDSGAGRQSWLDKVLSFSLIESAQAADVDKAADVSEQEPEVITIVAKRFEYVPNKISLKKGQRVTIRMESLDVTHGLYVDGYGIDIKARPGLIGKATFVADKPGRFSFRCSETCGEFHPYMIGFMEVTPNSRFKMFVAAICVTFLIVLVGLFRGGPQQKGAQANGTTE